MSKKLKFEVEINNKDELTNFKEEVKEVKNELQEVVDLLEQVDIEIGNKKIRMKQIGKMKEININ